MIAKATWASTRKLPQFYIGPEKNFDKWAKVNESASISIIDPALALSWRTREEGWRWAENTLGERWEDLDHARFRQHLRLLLYRPDRVAYSLAVSFEKNPRVALHQLADLDDLTHDKVIECFEFSALRDPTTASGRRPLDRTTAVWIVWGRNIDQFGHTLADKIMLACGVGWSRHAALLNTMGVESDELPPLRKELLYHAAIAGGLRPHPTPPDPEKVLYPFKS